MILPILLAIAAILLGVVCFVISNILYKKTSYYKITKRSFWSLHNDIGALGEYAIYKKLKFFEQTSAKFLFNLYLPTSHGKTTEIDEIMISSHGIFVFESKNYKGWIYGKENDTHWTQVLSQGQINNRFYNPILQNDGHIHHLTKLLTIAGPIYSIIVFSDNANLKNLQIPTSNALILNRGLLAWKLKKFHQQSINTKLTPQEIEQLYAKLYPYTQVDEAIKKQHVSNIHHD